MRLLLLIWIVLLSGCGEARKAFAAVDRATEIKLASGISISAEEAQQFVKSTQQLRDERDQMRVSLKCKDEAIALSVKRDEQKEKDAERAAVKAQSVYGRWLAGIIFGLATLITIFSFTPIGKFLPGWVGPVGMAAGIVILCASFLWLWCFDHIWYFIVPISSAMVLCGLAWLYKLLVLHKIVTVHNNALESGVDEVIAGKEALESEIKHGVHIFAKRVRARILKTT